MIIFIFWNYCDIYIYWRKKSSPKNYFFSNIYIIIHFKKPKKLKFNKIKNFKKLKKIGGKIFT